MERQTIHWHHPQLGLETRTGTPSMSGYVAKALKKFQHKVEKKPDQPFPSEPIKYGAKKQYATQPSAAPPLDAKGKKFIQQVCGKFLFLGRAVDSMLLCPINAIAS